jgi:hypothetical protein
VLAGSDLVMAVLAVTLAASFVGARSGTRSGLPEELDAYNAHVSALGRNSGAAGVRP